MTPKYESVLFIAIESKDEVLASGQRAAVIWPQAVSPRQAGAKASKIATDYWNGSLSSARLIPVVGNNIVPFIGRRAGDKGDDEFGVAHVEDFVGHAGFDVNEIAVFVL